MLDRSTGQGTLVLNDVRMYARETNAGGVSSVQLFFDRLALGIRVAAVGGIIECTQVSCQNGAAEEEEPIQSPFWSPLLGSVLESSWHMTNELDRSDALELRLRDAGSAGASRIVRIEASGAELLVSEVDAVRRVALDPQARAERLAADALPDRVPAAMPS